MDMKTISRLAVGILLIMALAGCSALAPEEPTTGNVEASEEAPPGIEAFTVTVEGQEYLCIKYERQDGGGGYQSGYYGLSCDPINSSESEF